MQFEREDILTEIQRFFKNPVGFPNLPRYILAVWDIKLYKITPQEVAFLSFRVSIPRR